jgi:hypothetical protein
MLRKVFGSKGGRGMAGGWIRIHKEELRNF